MSRQRTFLVFRLTAPDHARDQRVIVAQDAESAAEELVELLHLGVSSTELGPTGVLRFGPPDLVTAVEVVVREADQPIASAVVVRVEVRLTTTYSGRTARPWQAVA